MQCTVTSFPAPEHFTEPREEIRMKRVPASLLYVFFFCFPILFTAIKKSHETLFNDALNIKMPILFLSMLLLLLLLVFSSWTGLGRDERPEFSQATGIALVRCILSKFLGVACHCFPPLFRCSHFSPPGASTSATT